MATQIVQQGRAAWERLKKGRANYDDWVLVGHALIAQRKLQQPGRPRLLRCVRRLAPSQPA